MRPVLPSEQSLHMTTFRRANRHPFKRFLLVGTGWVLLVAGAVLGLIPVLQGWPLGIAGLLILASEYEWAHNLVVKVRSRFPGFARTMDRVSEQARRIVHKVRRKTHTTVQ
jgi:hypothetical protein